MNRRRIDREDAVELVRVSAVQARHNEQDLIGVITIQDNLRAAVNRELFSPVNRPVFHCGSMKLFLSQLLAFERGDKNSQTTRIPRGHTGERCGSPNARGSRSRSGNGTGWRMRIG
jgi:hypothetical protein